jgi:iron complex outermembrane receptor protein
VTTTTTISRNRLRTGSALRALALTGAGLMIGFAAPAFAQDATAQNSTQSTPAPQDQSQVQDIVVTGTLFRNPSAATASPVTTLSSTDLQARGITTIADAVQQLSANNGGTLNSNWSQFGFPKGASAPSLRGLTDGRTLTLFDGLRSAPYPLADDGYRNFVDINTIPDSIVDHVDVLQDGASSTYGADAVAGVVNVIIKKEITGLHLNASSAISQRGDDGEQRIDGTFGYGKLSEQGFNFYVNGEYQNNDALYLRQRNGPYGTDDHSNICGASNGNNPDIPAGTTTCMANGVVNGIQADGSFGGLGSTIVPATRQYNSTTMSFTDPGGTVHTFAPGKIAMSPYEVPNGCGNLQGVTLNAQQQAPTAPTWTAVKDENGNITGYTFNNVGYTGPTYAANQCQQDLTHDYTQYSGKIQRIGANAHLTVNIGSRAQAYAMFNFYETRTYNPGGAPRAYAGQTAAGGTQVTISPVLLPVYVCPLNGANAGYSNGQVTTPTACNASNGKLNPMNPFAAQGLEARVLGRYDIPTEDDTVARTFRYTAGINGSFGNGWNYTFDATHSDVYLRYTSKNYILAQNLLNVIADGSYNFFDPSANSQQIRDYIAPTQVNDSVSRLTLVQGTLGHAFFSMPGGDFQVAVGAAYRKESIDNPSANPANEANPYDRYYGINAVGVEGARNVKSVFYEVDAPIFDQLDLKATGRYDDYSSGQKNFSPKFEAQIRPVRQIKLRGTFSKGFAIPSFNEAYGLPTTGYITTQIDASTPGGAAFIAAHGGNAYATQAYSYGLTSIGNPAVKPEKSTSYTLGVVLDPVRWLTITADYYNIKIKHLITTPDCSAVVTQYYANNGVTTDPDCVTTPGVEDPAHPDALPLLGTITSVYGNANSLKTRGFDFTADIHMPISSGIRWNSNFNATYLLYLAKIDDDGTIERYDGTLGPCEITSCSGSPKFKGSWQNTLDFNGKGTLSATVYYTGGYDLEGADDGGIPGDCLGSIGKEVVTYSDGVTPVSCHTKRFIDVDLTGSIKVADKFTLYANVLNVFDTKPPFDPSAGYQLYQFNPAWAGAGFIGRYFRIGARVDF